MLLQIEQSNIGWILVRIYDFREHLVVLFQVALKHSETEEGKGEMRQGIREISYGVFIDFWWWDEARSGNLLKGNRIQSLDAQLWNVLVFEI